MPPLEGHPHLHPPNVTPATSMRRHHAGDNHGGTHTVPVPHYDQVHTNPFDDPVATQVVSPADHDDSAVVIQECRSDECLLLDLGTNSSSDGLDGGSGNENERPGLLPLAVSIDDAIGACDVW